MARGVHVSYPRSRLDLSFWTLSNGVIFEGTLITGGFGGALVGGGGSSIGADLKKGVQDS